MVRESLRGNAFTLQFVIIGVVLISGVSLVPSEKIDSHPSTSDNSGESSDEKSIPKDAVTHLLEEILIKKTQLINLFRNTTDNKELTQSAIRTLEEEIGVLEVQLVEARKNARYGHSLYYIAKTQKQIYK